MGNIFKKIKIFSIFLKKTIEVFNPNIVKKSKKCNFFNDLSI